MRLIALNIIALLGLCIPNTYSQTFTEDIADIVYNHCSTCHRPGEIGPFPMTNYEEVKAFGATIKAVTAMKFMPPWQPDSEYSRFMDENYLTDEQIKTISDWVDAGMPEGPANAAPPYPDFPEGSLLGEPDLVLEMEQAHFHPGDNKDEYMYFVLPTDLPEDKVIKAVELRPGNSRIVHHALFFQDDTGAMRNYDAQTSEYGFNAFNTPFGSTLVLLYDQFPGYVPGTKPLYYPEGLGQTLKAGADFVIQMHYAPTSIGQSDQSKVNIFFADDAEEIEREVEDYIMLPSNLPGNFGEFVIHPEEAKTFHGTWFINSDISLMGVSPHMHLLGTDWEVYLERPDGTRENLISIPEWDFNWQGAYYFPKFIKAPSGSVIHALASYDNTSENPNNPTIPPKKVSWGEGTTDEMYYLPIFYVPYEEGDENIVFDDIGTSTTDITQDFSQLRLHPISPNPISGNSWVNIAFELSKGESVNISIYDLEGKLVKQIRKNEFFAKGKHHVQLDAGQLAIGSYLVQLKTKNASLTQKLVKVSD